MAVSGTRFVTHPGPTCATLSRATGSALTLMTAGASARFTIHSRDALGQARPRVHSPFGLQWALSSSGSAGSGNGGASELVELADGAHVLQPCPTVSGRYNLRLLLGGTAPLGPSTFTMTVMPAPVCAALTTATGDGLTLATAGVTASFRVVSRDAYGNRCADSDGTIAVTSSVGHHLRVLPLASGVERIDWLYTVSGQYSLHVTANSRPIASSPFGHTLRPGPLSVPTSYAIGAALSIGTAGVHQRFTLIATDEWANPTDSPQLFAIRLTQAGAKSAAYAVASSIGAGRYTAEYSTSRSGRFDLAVLLLAAGGLQATYYSDQGLAAPLYSQVDEAIDFRWGSGGPLGTTTDQFSVRWRGFVRAADTGTHTFFVRADDGLRLAINGNILIDEWHIRTTSRFEHQAAVPLTAGQVYELVLEYFEEYASATIVLRWSTPASQVAQPIASKHLCFALEELIGSPFLLQVAPATACLALSTASAPAFSVATAGVATAFHIHLKDEFGNKCTGATLELLASLRSDRGTSFSWLEPVLQSTGPSAGSYEVAHTPTVSGTYTLYIGGSRPGGLAATFFEGLNLTDAVGSAVTSQIAYSGDDLESPHVQLSRGDDFSVRWAGLLVPSAAGEYSFEAALGGTDERVRLWIDNRLAIDQWTSLATIVPAVTIGLQAGSFYDLRLEYSENFGNQRISLSWESAEASIPKSLVPATSLRLPMPISGSPFQLVVLPSVVCASRTTAYGSSLSLATSGLQGRFTISARDAFDNRPLPGTFVTFAKSHRENLNLPLIRGVVSASSASSYTASLPSLRSGSASLSVALANVGGLMATYRKGIAPAAPSLARRDATVMLAPGTAAIVADGFGTDFSARWQGLVSAPNTATYTFYTEIAGADERVRLWLDNVLVVDEWSSLRSLLPSATLGMMASTLYEIELEYQNPTESYGFRLLWTGTGTQGRSLVPSSNLYTALHIASSPFALAVQPGSGCAAASIARGPGLSIATAGAATRCRIAQHACSMKHAYDTQPWQVWQHTFGSTSEMHTATRPVNPTAPPHMTALWHLLAAAV